MRREAAATARGRAAARISKRRGHSIPRLPRSSRRRRARRRRPRRRQRRSGRASRSRRRICGRGSQPRNDRHRPRSRRTRALVAARAQLEGDLTGGRRETLLALRGAAERVTRAARIGSVGCSATFDPTSPRRAPSPTGRRRSSSVVRPTTPTPRHALPHAMRDDLAERAPRWPRSASSRSSAACRARGDTAGGAGARGGGGAARARTARRRVRRERAVAAALGRRASAVVADAQRAPGAASSAHARPASAPLFVLVGVDPRALVLPVVDA